MEILNNENVTALISMTITSILAIVAIVQSHKANKNANIANKLAFQANRQSSKSNKLSESANEIAEKALQLSSIQELRQTTNEIVDWSFQIDHDWNIVITNIGTNTAHNVTVIVQIAPVKELKDRAKWSFVETRNGIDRIAPTEQFTFTSDNIVNVRDKARRTFVIIGGVYDHLAHGEITITIFWENSVGVLKKKVFSEHID